MSYFNQDTPKLHQRSKSTTSHDRRGIESRNVFFRKERGEIAEEKFCFIPGDNGASIVNVKLNSSANGNIFKAKIKDNNQFAELITFYGRFSFGYKVVSPGTIAILFENKEMHFTEKDIYNIDYRGSFDKYPNRLIPYISAIDTLMRYHRSSSNNSPFISGTPLNNFYNSTKYPGYRFKIETKPSRCWFRNPHNTAENEVFIIGSLDVIDCENISFLGETQNGVNQQNPVAIKFNVIEKISLPIIKGALQKNANLFSTKGKNNIPPNSTTQHQGKSASFLNKSNQSDGYSPSNPETNPPLTNLSVDKKKENPPRSYKQNLLQEGNDKNKQINQTFSQKSSFGGKGYSEKREINSTDQVKSKTSSILTNTGRDDSISFMNKVVESRKKQSGLFSKGNDQKVGKATPIRGKHFAAPNKDELTLPMEPAAKAVHTPDNKDGTFITAVPESMLSGLKNKNLDEMSEKFERFTHPSNNEEGGH